MEEEIGYDEYYMSDYLKVKDEFRSYTDYLENMLRISEKQRRRL